MSDEVKRIIDEMYEEETLFLNEVLERLKGYHCGQHKQLEKMIKNRIKRISSRGRETK